VPILAKGIFRLADHARVDLTMRGLDHHEREAEKE
jgi:hypothetical protein